LIKKPLKYYHIGIITTLVSILFAIVVPLAYIDLIGSLLIITLGILHGANDLEIISKNRLLNSKNFFIKSLIMYFGVVLLGGLFFFFLPSIALFTFILFSSYHFGEQHWEDRLKLSTSHSFFFTLYGAFIFFLIFITQYKDVALVIEKISGVLLPYEFFLWSLIFTGMLLLFIMMIIPSLRESLIKELFLLGLLYLLFHISSLLFSFAFYFVVWHSIPSLKEQINYLYGDLKKTSIKKYLKASLLYWISSLVFLGLILNYIDFNADYFLPMFFSFLAAITFPHTIVIGMMNRNKS
jgi:Brp/Blh family beta-carotene 15,15'-monooxygenase